MGNSFCSVRHPRSCSGQRTARPLWQLGLKTQKDRSCLSLISCYPTYRQRPGTADGQGRHIKSVLPRSIRTYRLPIPRLFRVIVGQFPPVSHYGTVAPCRMEGSIPPIKAVSHRCMTMVVPPLLSRYSHMWMSLVCGDPPLNGWVGTLHGPTLVPSPASTGCVTFAYPPLVLPLPMVFLLEGDLEDNLISFLSFTDSPACYYASAFRPRRQ